MKNVRRANNILCVALYAAMILIIVAVFSTTGHAAQDKTFAWDAYTDPGVDGFKLYCGKAANVQTIAENLQATITPATVTQYKKTGFTSGEWFCAMTAYNATQESVKSNEISFTVPIDPPGNFRTVEAIIAMILNKGAMK